MAGHRIASSRWRIVPGFLGASSTTGSAPAVDELDLTVLYAKTAPMGTNIPPAAWQKDRDPIFIWEAPATGAEVAGYSYALNGTADETIDTVGTSYDVASATPEGLAEGKHTFSVRAINSAGNAGKPISFELWVDATPPQIVSYAPAPAALVNTAPVVTVEVSDAGSGINATSAAVLVNGAAAGSVVDTATGTITASGVSWAEDRKSVV